MMILLSFITSLLFANGVFGVEVVSVIDEDSVTLHTNITETQRDHLIEWTFNNMVIASINREVNSQRVEKPNLQIHDQTGDLTIRNIRSEDSGLYEVDVSGINTSFKKLFNVSCVSDSSDKVKSVSVMNRDSVILHTDITEIKADDLIQWRFGPQRALIASFNKTSQIYNDAGGIKERLYLNPRNGDLLIRHTRNDTSGLYEVHIIRGGMSYTIKKSFNVTKIDGVKTLSVKEGHSVNLWSGVKKIHKDDVMLWWFEHEDSPIAKIIKTETFDGHNGRFKDRLKLDEKSGNLTINNLRREDSGIYHLDVTSSSHTLFMRFSVFVCEDNFSTGLMISLSITVAAVVAVFVAFVVKYIIHRSPKAKRLNVIEGNQVILHTDLTQVQNDDKIEWRFQETLIAQIQTSRKTICYNDVLDGKFRDRLTLRPSGSLIITDTKTTDAGLYELKITSGRKSSYKRFSLTVMENNGEMNPFFRGNDQH